MVVPRFWSMTFVVLNSIVEMGTMGRVSFGPPRMTHYA